MAVCAFSSTDTFGLPTMIFSLVGVSVASENARSAALSVMLLVGLSTSSVIVTLPSKLSLSACGTTATS